MPVQVRIIVSGQGSWRYVDCVAIRAGKLEALEYVRLMYGVPLNRCVAAGDSGNDILMLEGASPVLHQLHCNVPHYNHVRHECKFSIFGRVLFRICSTFYQMPAVYIHCSR